MSDLFSSLLPSSVLTGGVASVANSAVNYSLADTTSLLNEGYAKVQSTFGSVGSFSSLTSGSPSFTSLLSGISTSGKTANAALASAGTATDSASNIKAASTSDDSTGSNLTSHLVKLTELGSGELRSVINNVAFPAEPLSDRVVEFDVMPDLTEVRTVDYEALSAPQMPTEFQKYKGTKSTQWNLSGNMVCRTRDEAFRNLQYINTLRGWTQGYFGNKQLTQFSSDPKSSSGKLGAPPPVLAFKGYRGLIGEVPVVLTSTNWSWPHDCDWIPTGQKDSDGQEIPFPTVLNISVSLVESFSPDQVNSFDLVAFRNGDMIGAWQNILPTTDTAPNVAEAQGGNQGATQGTASPDPSTNSNSTAPSSTQSGNPNFYSNAASNAVTPQDNPNSFSTSASNATAASAGSPLTTTSTPPADSADIASQKADLNRSIQITQNYVNSYTKQLADAQTALANAQASGNAGAITQASNHVDTLNRYLSSAQSDLATYQSQLAALG